jgi:hypothetical protein
VRNMKLPLYDVTVKGGAKWEKKKKIQVKEHVSHYYLPSGNSSII